MCIPPTESASPAATTWGTLNKAAYEKAVGYLNQQGAPLRDLIEKMGTDTLHAVQKEWAKGMALGYNPNKIAKNIANATANIALGGAKTIARTEFHRAYRQTKAEQMNASDVTAGWVSKANLDSETCGLCVSMGGSIDPKGDVMDSHPNCRCSMVPLTKTWDELGFPGVPGDRPLAMNTPSGPIWLGNQGEAAAASALIVAARPFRTGQFNMLYAFGVGEAPISISGNEAHPERIAHTVRAVGPVTSALAKLRAGDVVGVRGPYGTAWPVEESLDRDVVVVAGGLGVAPLAPAIDALAKDTSRTGRLIILAGARTPADFLFSRRVAAWRKADRTEVLTTVDRASPDWRDHVGVVPALLDLVHVNPARTAALVCGPEVMMRFTVRELSRRGVTDERIYLSMERNMKCAVGVCGHCQLGPSFVCKDGTVLGYDRLRPLFWLREI